MEQIEILCCVRGGQFHPSQEALELYNQLSNLPPVSDKFELGDSDAIPRHDPVLLQVYHQLGSHKFRHESAGSGYIDSMWIPKKYENHYRIQDENDYCEYVRVNHSEYLLSRIRQWAESQDAATATAVQNILDEPMEHELWFNYE